MKSALSGFDFDVIPFDGPEAALKEIETLNPDCILTDYEMPVMSGPELIKVLKANPRVKDVPVVVLSTHDNDRAIIECISAGAEDYLLKRTNPEVVIAKLKLLSELKNYRDLALKSERIKTYNATVVTINHELRNAGAIVLGQLEKIVKRTAKDSQLNTELINEHEVLKAGLDRLWCAIQSLAEKNDDIRFADYGDRTQMVDIKSLSKPEKN